MMTKMITPSNEPRELFRRIQKRDGRIVDFEKAKIVETIWKTAESIGGKDRALSVRIADRVILHLSNTHEDQLLGIEEVQDAVEKILVEEGHGRTVKAYILYREEMDRARRFRREVDPDYEATPYDDPQALDLVVETSSEGAVKWDPQRIADALALETGMTRNLSHKIAREVEREIIYSRLQTITTPLVRELVNAKLMEHGFEDEYRLHSRLGVSLFNAESVIIGRDEADFSGIIHQQFALRKVFSQAITDGHQRGEIYLGGLDQIDRLFQLRITPEYVKSKGWPEANSPGWQKPAKEWSILVEQLARQSANLGSQLSGELIWEGFNIFLSPLLKNDPAMETKLEQLLYRLADDQINHPCVLTLYPTVPAVFKSARAIGFEGKVIDRDYDSLTETVGKILLVILRIYQRSGDLGLPDLELHLSAECLAPEATELLSKLLNQKAPITLVFPREKGIDSAPRRDLSITGIKWWEQALANPSSYRLAALGKVSLNLKHAAAYAHSDEGRLYDGLTRQLELAAQAMREKRDFLELLGGDPNLIPLEKSTTYLGVNLPRAAGLIEPVGLLEAIAVLQGDHENNSGQNYRLGLRILSHLNLECRRLARKHHVCLMLHEGNIENAASHFIALDEDDSLNPKATINNLTALKPATSNEWPDRVNWAGQTHDLFDGSIVAELKNDSPFTPESIKATITYTMNQTRVQRLRF